RDHLERAPAWQRMANRRARDVAMLLVQPHPGKRRHQLERPESGPYRLRFAASENRTPDPVAGMRRVDEERPDLGRVRLRIEPGLIALGARVAAEQRPPPAPAAARDDVPCARLGHEVGPVAYQRRLHG